MGRALSSPTQTGSRQCSLGGADLAKPRGRPFTSGVAKIPWRVTWAPSRFNTLGFSTLAVNP
jgi:hypothetical protein